MYDLRLGFRGQVLQGYLAMPAPVETHKPVQIYQIKVMLRDSHPPIWLRIQVTSDTTLAKLHRILQRVMGWEDTHLHISTSSSSGTRATARLTRTTRDRARCGTNESTNWSVWMWAASTRTARTRWTGGAFARAVVKPVSLRRAVLPQNCSPDQ